MQILLSCAKTMAEIPAATFAAPLSTRPLYAREAGELAAQMAAFTADELGRLLGVNATLAAENRRRYLHFHDKSTSLPAIAAYTGIVFKHINPQSFTDADFEYAQRHLNITSFLYGLLRPLDAIHPYRLEGDVILPGNGEQTVFAYWRQRLTDAFLDKIRNDDGILLNLSSGEMKRLFDWQRICREVRVITPEFRIREGDHFRTVVVYTKMCRGEMARTVLRNRIGDPGQLREFAWEGFHFDAARSRTDAWAFTL